MPPRNRRHRRAAPRGGALILLVGVMLAALLVVSGDPALFLAGLVLGWLAVGPVGVGWLATRYGRDPAAWLVLALLAPVLGLAALLAAGPVRR